jgi:uridine phosphorylase
MPTLPDPPNLGHLRRQAKDLLRSANAADDESLARIRRVSDRLNLASAQLALSREYGFSSWARLRVAVIGGSSSGVAPLMTGKHNKESISRPADFIGWARSQGWDPGPLPAGMVFTSSAHLTVYLQQDPAKYRLSTTLTPTNGQVFVTRDEPLVAIACLGAGASGVVTEVEHLVQLGVTTFLAVGPAPALSEDVVPGDCVVVDKALRDDGVSQHYVVPARYAFPDDGLTRSLLTAAEQRGLRTVTGSTWTVPTPYRTTADELTTFRAEGVLTTELSTAALFAVASCLGVSAASALIVTRHLGRAEVARGASEPTDQTLQLLGAAIDTIQARERGR